MKSILFDIEIIVKLKYIHALDYNLYRNLILLAIDN